MPLVEKMSLELTIYPEKYRSPSRLFYTNNQLDFEQDMDLFERIRALESHAWPRDETFFIREGDGEPIDGWCSESTDLYGDPLRFVYASDMAKLEEPAGDAWNGAVLAFIRALPPNTRIVLYWN